MYPILLQIGPITIYSLWVFVAIGFLVALLVLNKMIQKDRTKLYFIADHSLAIFFGGLVFARLFFVLRNYFFFLGRFELGRFLEIFYIWDKGLSFWGGMIGITLTLLYFCYKNGENMKKWMDILTVSIISGIIFGNIGALLDGAINYGNETDLPWGIVLTNSRYAVPIHPTQIYAAIYCCVLAIVLLKLRNSKIGKTEGNIALIGMTGYSFLRFLEEFLRGDESNYLLGLREAQIYCLLALIAGGVIFYRRYQKSHQQPTIKL